MKKKARANGKPLPASVWVIFDEEDNHHIFLSKKEAVEAMEHWRDIDLNMDVVSGPFKYTFSE